MILSPAARAVRERLFTDFEFYAQNALWIRTKDQKVVPLELNKEAEVTMLPTIYADASQVVELCLSLLCFFIAGLVTGWLLARQRPTVVEIETPEAPPQHPHRHHHR